MTLILERLDHIHIHVADRPAAERWYHQVLGLERHPRLEVWAVPHGPLMLRNTTGTIQLALFKRPPEPNRATVAFGVEGPAFLAWCQHLTEKLKTATVPVDHGLAWSIYFADPDGNPFEITTYDYAHVAGSRGPQEGQ